MPNISFVVTSRNDDDAPTAIHRMQLFIDGLLDQAQRYGLDSELIIVEWNPPDDRLNLGDVLKLPTNKGCPVRIIKVPNEVHDRFENSGEIPLFQMIAKNAGIRRALGEFVLATNIDILFSDRLIKFLASRRLKENRMYRIDRYDVPSNIPFQLSHNALMDWCQQNVFRLYRYKEIVEIKNGYIPPRSKAQAHRLDFVKRYYERKGRLSPHLHTNACGDFTLLSEKYWQEVRGYPEFPMRAMKLDGLLCYAAHYAGAREYILKDPMRIYHIDHPERGDGAAVALTERVSGQVKKLQIPVEQYRALVSEMMSKRAPIIFNTSDWGLADLQLEETVIA